MNVKAANLVGKHGMKLIIGVLTVLVLATIVTYFYFDSQIEKIEIVSAQGEDEIQEIKSLPSSPGGLPGSGACGSPTCTGGTTCTGGCGGGCGG